MTSLTTRVLHPVPQPHPALHNLRVDPNLHLSHPRNWSLKPLLRQIHPQLREPLIKAHNLALMSNQEVTIPLSAWQTTPAPTVGLLTITSSILTPELYSPTLKVLKMACAALCPPTQTSVSLSCLLSISTKYSKTSLNTVAQNLKHVLGTLCNSCLNVELNNRTSTFCETCGNISTDSNPLLSPLMLATVVFGFDKLQWDKPLLTPLDLTEWTSRYPVKRRKELEEARHSVSLLSLSQRDSRVRNFLKIETSTTDTDPRNISPRTDRYLSFVGPFISALEHSYQDLDFLVKGLTTEQRNTKLDSLLDYDMYIETDYSRFDRHISLPILMLFEFVALTYRFDDPELNAAISYSWKTFGFSEYGTMYDVTGTRCSGDAWTSIGNGLLNKFLTWICMRDIKHHSIHEGDDGIIAIHNKDLGKTLTNLKFLTQLGFTAKIEVRKHINYIGFCGRKYYVDGCNVKSYCDLNRSLAKFHTTCSAGDPKALACAKAMSYHYTDHATPLIGTITHVIIKHLLPTISARRLKRAIKHITRERPNVRFSSNNKWQLSPVSPAARAAASLTSNISPTAQLAFENYYLSLPYVPDKFDKLPIAWEFSDRSHVHLFDCLN